MRIGIDEIFIAMTAASDCGPLAGTDNSLQRLRHVFGSVANLNSIRQPRRVKGEIGHCGLG